MAREKQNTQWTPEDDETLIRMASRGRGNKYIASKLKRTESGVSKRRHLMIRQGRLKPKHQVAPWSNEDLDFLMEARRLGMGYAEIAEALGRELPAVRARYHNQCYVMRQREKNAKKEALLESVATKPEKKERPKQRKRELESKDQGLDVPDRILPPFSEKDMRPTWVGFLIGLVAGSALGVSAAATATVFIN